MRALGVARVSTQEQAQGDRFSIPHQRQRITEYCLQREWELLDVVEYVHSGGSNFRQLEAILQTVTHDHVDVVVVNELDRLARDMVSTMLFLEDLQKIGCRFVSVSDDLDLTTPDGELKMMMLSMFAHYFRRQLARKIKGGLQERARQGKHHGGTPPYGFVFAGDKLGPHPDQAPVVQQIYRWYVDEGLGGREIAKRLIAQGIPTQTGHGTWIAPDILRLLRRRANVGDLQHGAVEWVQERSGVAHKRYHPEPLVVADAHPGLVDRDTWSRAQRLLAERRTPSGRSVDSPYLLSGLVHCGLCGCTMVPVKSPRRQTRYVCRGYQQSGTCSAKHAQPVPLVERTVLATLLGKLEAPSVPDITAWLTAQAAHDDAYRQQQRERGRLQRALANLPAMRDRAEDALLQGAFTIPQYQAACAKLDAEAHRLESALAALEDRALALTPDAARLLEADLVTAREQLANASTLQERRTVVRRYIRWVEISPDEIRVHLEPRPTAPPA